MDKVRIGIIGCGNISGAYLKYAQLFPKVVEVVAVADLEIKRAQTKAKEFAIAKACSAEQLLADKSVELVVNLTPPKAHGEVALAALAAGKHIYNEKPLATDRKLGRKILTTAKRKKLRVGGAPDTFFGSAAQTARKLIDDGAIGRPVAATAFMMGRGPEGWHPDPEFFYKPGGGPLFDMGPYYLTALVNLLGPMRRVAAAAAIAIPERTIGSQPKHGGKIHVETPDHIAGVIDFSGGAVGTLVTSFAVMHSPHPPITIFGTEGTLAVPDPNQFDGTVQVRGGAAGDKEWKTIAPTHTAGYGRMVGVVDMAYGVRGGRAHRANGDLTFHVLDAMQGFLEAAASGKAYDLSSQAERPAALPAGLTMGELDA
jgi:predicted dehydrogenase